MVEIAGGAKMIPCDTCKIRNFHFDKSAGRVCVQDKVIIVVEKVRKYCPMYEEREAMLEVPK